MSVYILHFLTPLKHAQHYAGFSENMWTLRERIKHHQAGTARCKLTDAVHRNGISVVLARVFRGKQYDRHFERKLKNRAHLREYCPICAGEAVKDYHPRRPNE